jgi:hypothetical protein
MRFARTFYTIGSLAAGATILLFRQQLGAKWTVRLLVLLLAIKGVVAVISELQAWRDRKVDAVESTD